MTTVEGCEHRRFCLIQRTIRIIYTHTKERRQSHEKTISWRKYVAWETLRESVGEKVIAKEKMMGPEIRAVFDRGDSCWTTQRIKYGVAN